MKSMRRNEGFTLIELLIVVAIISVIAAVAVPNYMGYKRQANESVAISSVRAITSGETAYAASCGGGGYAQSNADLAKAPEGGIPFISPDLAKADETGKSGYRVTVASNKSDANQDVLDADKTCNGSAAASQSMYYVGASPMSPGRTGIRHFGSDHRGTIYFHNEEVPNPIEGIETFIQ